MTSRLTGNARQLGLAALILVSPVIAAAQGLNIGTVRGQYDDVANCLMGALPPALKGWPTVYLPPRNEALLNVHVRGNDKGVPPVAVFLIRSSGSGSHVQLLSGSSQYEAMARSSVQRCAQ